MSEQRLPFPADDSDDPIDLWVRSGYIDPSLDSETKAEMRLIAYEMHLEDLAYERLAKHLGAEHGVADWELMAAGTCLNGTYSIPPISQMHAQLHGAEPELPTMWHPTERHTVGTSPHL